MRRLIDVSVVVKWIVPEADSALASSWQGVPLAAPDFLVVELANSLWKKVQQGQASPEQALAGLVEVRSLIDLVPVSGLELRALEIGLALNHPVYDCFYLALAETLETRIVTADTRMVRCCAGSEFERLVEPLA